MAATYGMQFSCYSQCGYCNEVLLLLWFYQGGEVAESSRMIVKFWYKIKVVTFSTFVLSLSKAISMEQIRISMPMT